MATNNAGARDHEFISIADVATELRVTERFIRRLIADGELQTVKIGGLLLRIRRSDLDHATKPVCPLG